MSVEEDLERIRAENNELRRTLADARDQLASLHQLLYSVMPRLEDVVERVARIERGQQEQATPQTLESFRDRLRILTKDAQIKQRDLAEAIPMNPTDFSNRLRGHRGVRFTQAQVERIVEILTINGAFKTRASAVDVLQLFDYPNLSDERWRGLEAELGYELPYANEIEKDRLRRDLTQKDKVDLLSLIAEGVYSRALLEGFVTDRIEPVGLRLLCLELYLEQYKSPGLADQLLDDPYREIVIRTLKSVVTYKLVVGNDFIRKALQIRIADNDIILNAARVARYLVLEQGADPSLLIEATFVNHKEWGVKSNVIKGITEHQPPLPNALELLAHFKDTVTYFKTRQVIYRYINDQHTYGNLKGSDFPLAASILQTFMNDGHSSNKEVEQMSMVLEKISAWNQEED